MKPFTKKELISVVVIFLILIGISIPNFIISLRRARDQARRDDMGAMEKALGEYFGDFQEFPLSAPDGRILACKNPGDEVKVDSKGRLIVNLIPCEWGKDALVNLAPGSAKVYIKAIPEDPNFQNGISFRYFSDGQRYQFFVSLEGKDEDEYDSKIVARNISCGNVICNAGRFYGCPIDKTLAQCEAEAGQ